MRATRVEACGDCQSWRRALSSTGAHIPRYGYASTRECVVPVCLFLAGPYHDVTADADHGRVFAGLERQSQAADGLHRDCLRTAHAIQTLISTRSPYVQQPVAIWLTSDYGLVSSQGGTMRRTITALITLTVLPGPDGRSDSGAKAHALCYQAATLPAITTGMTQSPRMLSTQMEEDCA
jgi:hypothetical protein